MNVAYFTRCDAINVVWESMHLQHKIKTTTTQHCGTTETTLVCMANSEAD